MAKPAHRHRPVSVEAKPQFQTSANDLRCENCGDAFSSRDVLNRHKVHCAGEVFCRCQVWDTGALSDRSKRERRVKAQQVVHTQRGIGLFTILGINVRIDYAWFIVIALVLFSLSLGYFPRTYPGQSSGTYWTTGLLATLLFCLSMITHELAYSFMTLRSGIKIREVTLFIFGGMARLSEPANDPKTEFKIAVAGPLTSFVLAGFFWLVQFVLMGDEPSIFVETFGYLAWINVALAVFNLIPGFPLDGNRLFRAFWWWKSGSVNDAARAASDWGKGFAIVLMIVGGLQIFAGSLVVGLSLIFIGIFLRGMAEASYQNLPLEKSLEGTRVEQASTRDVVSASHPMRQLKM